MTIYVSDRPWQTRDGWRFNLWADSSGEAVAAIFAIGGDLSQQRAECNSWEAYAITGEQFADAVSLGITVTDGLGPAEWCARRDGHKLLLGMIESARARGCA